MDIRQITKKDIGKNPMFRFVNRYIATCDVNCNLIGNNKADTQYIISELKNEVNQQIMDKLMNNDNIIVPVVHNVQVEQPGYLNKVYKLVVDFYECTLYVQGDGQPPVPKTNK